MDETHNLDMVFTNPGGAIDGKKLHQLEWLKHWSVDGWTCSFECAQVEYRPFINHCHLDLTYLT